VCVVRRCRPAAAAAAAAALLFVTGCAQQGPQAPVSNVSTRDDDGLHGVVLPKPYDVPHVRLTDTGGAPYALDTGSTKPVTLMFFGYTHCPDICQIVMADLASAVTRLDPAHRDKVTVLFVTTDPARDDRRTLRRYLDRFNPRFDGLTGPLPHIVAAGTALGVPIQQGARLPSGGYEVEHGTQVVAALPDGTAPVVWTEGTSPADIAADLDTILDHGVPTTGSSQ
jgi:protein SCO1